LPCIEPSLHLSFESLIYGDDFSIPPIYTSPFLYLIAKKTKSLHPVDNFSEKKLSLEDGTG